MKHFRVAKALARDPELPRWLRAMLVFGLLPIPGPVDDVVAGAAAIIIVVFYRHRIRHHYWIEALKPAELYDTWGSWS